MDNSGRYDIKAAIAAYEDPEQRLHDKMGKLSLLGHMVLRVALNSPQEHHTIDLGIKGFKRMLAQEMPHLTKKQRNEQIRKYKQHAWQDYAELVQFKGSHPTVRIQL